MTKAFRATFEDVLSAQETLHHWIDDLITKRGNIDSYEKRDKLFKLLGHATLGLGWEQPFVFRDGDDEIRWPNVDFALRLLAASPGNYDEGTQRKLWKAILDHLYLVFPKALDRASAISPERLPFERTKATHVGREAVHVGR